MPNLLLVGPGDDVVVVEFNGMKRTGMPSTKTRSTSRTARAARPSSGAAAAPPTAKRYIAELKALSTPEELRKIQRYFKTEAGDYGAGDRFLGVRMGQVFALSKAYVAMSPDEIERLLESPLHEVRAGGLSIMDKQARNPKTGDAHRKALYDLYLRRIDRINNWDLVDLAAPFVIGGYLAERSRRVLYRLANSKNIWERRTAIVSTAYFLRHGEVADTFKIAELLLDDEHDLIHKAVGGWVREAGRQDRPQLLAFLDRHAATMPRVMLRYATEHLDAGVRARYLGKASTRSSKR